MHRGQIEAFLGQRQQVFALGDHRRADRLAAPGDDAVLLLVHTGGDQLVQLFQIAHMRHGRQIVAAILPTFTLDATLFVSLAGRTELGGKAPVRAESDEPGGLFALMAAQDLLHRAGQVVEAQAVKDPAKPPECQLVGFQKRLLRGMRIDAVKGRAAGHRAHAEDVDLAALVIALRGSCREAFVAGVEIDPALVPIHLRFAAKLVGLRDKDLMSGKPHGDLALVDIAAHRRLGDRVRRVLLAQTRPDPMRCMTLLARRLAVGLQDLVDEGSHRRQLRPLSFRNFSFGGNGARQRLPHLAAMNSKLPRYAADRAGAMLVLPPDLLV